MSEFLDALILLWLIGTWFYEGHHKRCKVEVVCPKCKREHDEDCCAIANGPTEKCEIPPPGWYCTRAAGHLGPCAAWPQNHFGASK